MKKIIIIFISLILLIGCSKNEEVKEYDDEQHYNNEFVEKINNGSILLDVRTKEEYDNVRIKSAINIPYDEIEKRFENEVTNDKNKEIIVYCKSGVRAELAVNTLLNMGYTNVYSIGGIDNITDTSLLEGQGVK